MRSAQRTFSDVFSFVGDQVWADNPVGELAYHWESPTGQSATRLINLAAILDILLTHTPSGEKFLLKSKISALLRGPEMVFEENLAELEVGAVLSSHFRPFILEPLVPRELLDHPNKPASPDYGIEVPEGLVLVDATVWHWENLSAWHRMRMEMKPRLFSAIDKAGVARDVLLHLPIKPSKNALEILASPAMCNKIAGAESGEEIIEVGASRPARICWTEFEPPTPAGWNPASIPKFTEAPIDPALVVKSHPYVVVGVRFAPQAGYLHFTTDLCLTEQDIEEGLQSLRVALERKKRQARSRPDLPYVVAVHLYSGTASWNDFLPMVEERLWPNPKYGWLSGIVAHEPEPARLSGTPQSATPSLWLVPNPNATVPVPESLLAQ